MKLYDIKDLIVNYKSIKQVLLGILSLKKDRTLLNNHDVIQQVFFEFHTITSIKSIKKLSFDQSLTVPYSEELQVAINSLEAEMDFNSNNEHILNDVKSSLDKALKAFNHKEQQEIEAIFNLLNKYKNKPIINNKQFTELFIIGLVNLEQKKIPTNYFQIMENIMYSNIDNELLNTIDAESFLKNPNKFKKEFKTNFIEFLKRHNNGQLKYDLSNDCIIIEIRPKEIIKLLYKYNDEIIVKMENFCLLFIKNCGKESTMPKSDYALKKL